MAQENQNSAPKKELPPLTTATVADIWKAAGFKPSEARASFYRLNGVFKFKDGAIKNIDRDLELVRLGDSAKLYPGFYGLSKKSDVPGETVKGGIFKIAADGKITPSSKEQFLTENQRVMTLKETKAEYEIRKGAPAPDKTQGAPAEQRRSVLNTARNLASKAGSLVKGSRSKDKDKSI